MLTNFFSSNRPVRVFAIVVVVELALAAASAQSGKLIYHFTGAPDSYQPNSGLVADSSGNLYGTAINNTVFKLSPPVAAGGPWSEAVIFTFNGTSDGTSPSGSRLAIDRRGNLYGANSFGGTINSVCSQGCATVFELSPPVQSGDPWTKTILYSFAGGSGGRLPVGVTMPSNGWLVGAALTGGDIAGDGLVFVLQPPSIPGSPWTKKNLYVFQGGADGSGPNPPMLADRNHNLFSTTQVGGLSGTDCPTGCGTIFELTPPSGGSGTWTKTTIYNFQGGLSDGFVPDHGLVSDTSGNLYGTTFLGGFEDIGLVFELSPPTSSGGAWTETILHMFGGGMDDGMYPYGVVLDRADNLYGTTDEGGSGIFSGGIFYQLSPPTVSGGTWSETVLHNFAATDKDGSGPESPPLLLNGFLYGATAFGGGTQQCSSGCGVIYSIRP